MSVDFIQEILDQFSYYALATLLCHKPSLVPRPSLTAFFAAVEKIVGLSFCHGCEKSCEGRPGYEATVSLSDQSGYTVLIICVYLPTDDSTLFSHDHFLYVVGEL